MILSHFNFQHLVTIVARQISLVGKGGYRQKGGIYRQYRESKCIVVGMGEGVDKLRLQIEEKKKEKSL